MALLLPPAELQFSDANGNPYAGGTLATYIPATMTPKTTWQNAAETVANPNPIVLDSAGRCILYGNGVYRTILSDASGNLIWDQLTSSAISDAMAPVTLAADLPTARSLMGIDTDIAAAIAAYVASSPNRTPVAANTTWYVDGTLGSDANTGLAPAGVAFATIQHALNVLQTLYDGRGFAGTISVASGTYNVGTGLLAAGPFVGFSNVTLACSATRSSVILQSTAAVLTAQYGAVLYINGGFEFDTSTAGYQDIQAILGAQIFITGPVTLGPTPTGTIFYATRFGYIEIDVDIYINGGTSGNLLQSSHSGNIRHTNGAIIHFNANHNFTDATLYALFADITITAAANFNLGGYTISGQQYRAAECGIIQWALGTNTSIPGSLQGNEQLGGRYDRGNYNLSIWSGSFNYDMSTATGASTVITGVGFMPGEVEFLANVFGGAGWGSVGFATMVYNVISTVPGNNYCTGGGASSGQPNGNGCVVYNTTNVDGVAATLTSVTPDGFTLAWAKAGSPTGTLTVYWKARRGL